MNKFFFFLKIWLITYFLLSPFKKVPQHEVRIKKKQNLKVNKTQTQKTKPNIKPTVPFHIILTEDNA